MKVLHQYYMNYWTQTIQDDHTFLWNNHDYASVLLRVLKPSLWPKLLSTEFRTFPFRISIWSDALAINNSNPSGSVYGKCKSSIKKLVSRNRGERHRGNFMEMNSRFRCVRTRKNYASSFFGIICTLKKSAPGRKLQNIITPKIYVEVMLWTKIHKYTHIYATANSDCSCIYQHATSKCPKSRFRHICQCHGVDNILRVTDVIL